MQGSLYLDSVFTAFHKKRYKKPLTISIRKNAEEHISKLWSEVIAL